MGKKTKFYLVAADALNADESLSEQEKDLELRCISALLSSRSFCWCSCLWCAARCTVPRTSCCRRMREAEK